jgi:hypothetical protein
MPCVPPPGRSPGRAEQPAHAGAGSEMLESCARSRGKPPPGPCWPAPVWQPAVRLPGFPRRYSRRWALHLTGAGNFAPRPIQCRPIQAGRMPTFYRRRRRHLPGALCGDEVLVPDRYMDNRKFQDTVEPYPSAAGAPTVEPEYKFVEVAGQMGCIHGSLMGAEYPALGQRGDPVHSRQQFTGLFSTIPGGILAKMVPAVTEVRAPHPVHMNLPSPIRHPAGLPQGGSGSAVAAAGPDRAL